MPGGTYFFTVCLADRRATTLTDHIDFLGSSVEEARTRAFFDIDAMVILPDHLHAIWTLPPDDKDYPGRWRRIKSRFSQELHALGAAGQRTERGEYGVWQKRYWEHTIRDDTDFSRHADYIHFNTVMHLLASRVSDWPYSSFRHYVAAGYLAADWGGFALPSDGTFGER